MDARAFLKSALCGLSATIWVTACGDDTAQPGSDAAADVSHDATQDVRRETGPVADVGPAGDGGLPAPPTGCYSAADCTDAGSHALCCYTMSIMAIACVPEGGACDYVQCQVCDNECPVGLSCIASPFGGKIKYCAAGDGGGGSNGSGTCGQADAGADAADSGEGGDAADTGATVDSGSDGGASEAATDAGTDAPADAAADVMNADAHE